MGAAVLALEAPAGWPVHRHGLGLGTAGGLGGWSLARVWVALLTRLELGERVALVCEGLAEEEGMLRRRGRDSAFPASSALHLSPRGPDTSLASRSPAKRGESYGWRQVCSRWARLLAHPLLIALPLVPPGTVAVGVALGPSLVNLAPLPHLPHRPSGRWGRLEAAPRLAAPHCPTCPTCFLGRPHAERQAGPDGLSVFTEAAR